MTFCLKIAPNKPYFGKETGYLVPNRVYLEQFRCLGK